MFTMSSTRESKFFDLQTQFLCCVPVKKVQWKDSLDDLSWDEQKQLLDETVNLPTLQKFPLDSSYVVRFLRFIIDKLEHSNQDVHDDFYTLLCKFQSTTNDDSEYSYKHYQISTNRDQSCVQTVSLKENRNKISQGTTGLNVWESALAISDWAIQNKHEFQNKRILELGAGTGLSSLIIGKCCEPKSVCITDGNDRVIANLLENVSNNYNEATENRFISQDGNTTVDVMKLDWSDINEENISTLVKETDLIIAADVIYDNSLFDYLLTTLKVLLNQCDNCQRFLLVNAVRNPQTEEEFLTKLGTFGMKYHEEPTIHRKFLHWEANEYSPIKLYSIYKG